MGAQLGVTSSTSAGNDSNDSGTLSVSYAVSPASGPLGTGYFYFPGLTSSGSRSQAARLVIYSSNATPAPLALLGVTDEVVLSDASPVGVWVPFPTWTHFGGPPSVVNGTAYWIGFWWGTQVGTGRLLVPFQTLTPQAQIYTADTYSSTGSPATVPATVGSNRTYSLYFDIPGAGGIRTMTGIGS